MFGVTPVCGGLCADCRSWKCNRIATASLADCVKLMSIFVFTKFISYRVASFRKPQNGILLVLNTYKTAAASSASFNHHTGRCLRHLSDAIVSAMQYCPLRTLLHMQSCPGLCKNRPADMYMTVRVCVLVSEWHALNLRIIRSMNIHVFYDCSEYQTADRTFRMSFMTCT